MAECLSPGPNIPMCVHLRPNLCLLIWPSSQEWRDCSGHPRICKVSGKAKACDRGMSLPGSNGRLRTSLMDLLLLQLPGILCTWRPGLLYNFAPISVLPSLILSDLRRLQGPCLVPHSPHWVPTSILSSIILYSLIPHSHQPVKFFCPCIPRTRKSDACTKKVLSYLLLNEPLSTQCQSQTICSRTEAGTWELSALRVLHTDTPVRSTGWEGAGE